jgi:hypothetical protein
MSPSQLLQRRLLLPLLQWLFQQGRPLGLQQQPWPLL